MAEDLKFNPLLTAPSEQTATSREAAETARSDAQGVFDNVGKRFTQEAQDTSRTTLTSQLTIAGAERAVTPGTLLNWSYKQISDNAGLSTFAPDYDTLPTTAEDVKNYFTEKNIPQEQWEGLMERAVSKDHLDYLVGNRTESAEALQRSSQNGWVGNTGFITGMLFDPVSAAVTVGSAGAAGVAAQGIRASTSVAARALSSETGLAFREAVAAKAPARLATAIRPTVVTATDAAKVAEAGVVATEGAAVVSQGITATDMGKYFTGLSGAALGGVGFSYLDAVSRGEEWTASKATQMGLTFAGLHMGIEAMGMGMRKWRARKEGEASTDAMKDAGAKVDEARNDRELHQETTPIDPNFKKTDAAETGPRPKDPDLEVPKAESREVLDNMPKEKLDEVKPAKGSVEAIEKAKGGRPALEEVTGLLEPYVSKLAPTKLKTAKWGRTDGGPVTLRFESQVDQDMFYMSFSELPKDAARRMARLRKAMPGYAEDEILEAAQNFRTTELRRLTQDHPTVDTLDIPNHYGRAGADLVGEKAAAAAGTTPWKSTLAVAAGAAVAATAVQAAEAAPGGTVGSAVTAVAGVVAGAAIAKGRRGGKKATPAAPVATPAAPAGNALPGVLANGTVTVPAVVRPQLGTLINGIPRLSKTLEKLATGAEFGLIPALSKSDAMVLLGDMMLTPVANKAGRVRVNNAADLLKDTHVEGIMAQHAAARTEGINAWAKSKGFSSYLQATLDFRTQIVDEFERAAFAHKVDSNLNTSPAARKYADKVADLENQTAKRFIQVYDQAKRDGVVFAADSPIERLVAVLKNPDKQYVRLMHNYENMREFAAESQQEFYNMIAGAIRAQNPGVTQSAALIRAKLFADTILRMEADPTIARLARVDPSGALDELVKRGWADPNSAEDLLSVLNLLAPEAAPGVTKARFSMDRTYIHRFTDPQGRPREWRVDDIYIKDLSTTHGDWMDQVAGNLALLQSSMKYKFDLSSKANLEAILEEARITGATPREIEVARGAWQKIKGDAGHTTVFGESTEIGSTIRLVTAIGLGKYFVAATLPEGASGLVGGQLAKSHRRAFPGFMEAVRTITGRPPKDPLTRSIVASTGIGAEGIGSVSRYSLEHGIQDKALNSVRVVAQKAFWANLTSGFDNLFKAMHARGVAQFALDVTNGTFKLTDDYIAKTLAPIGIDRAMLDKLAPLLRKHAVLDSRGILKDMRFERIHAEDPWLAAQFESAMRKHAKIQASQPASLGSSSPFLSGEVTKTWFQFIQPVILAQNRALRDGGNFNRAVAARWAMSFVTAGVAYAGRTYVQYGHDEEELNRRLTTEAIMKAAFRNSMFAGLSPLLIDSTFFIFGEKPPFQDQTNRGFGSITPPAAGLASMALNTVRTGFQVATGDPSVTSGQVRSALSPLQLSQWWTQPLVNAVSESYPQRRPRDVNPDE